MRRTDTADNGGHAATGLAAGNPAGDLFIDGAGELIEDLPASCVQTGSVCAASAVFGEVGEGALSEGAGLGVDPQSGTVYAGDVHEQQVFAYGVSIEADIEPPVEVGTNGTATLRGTVDPEGVELTRCEFEYGPTTSYGSLAPCEESLSAIGSGSTPVAVRAKLAGLETGTTYHYRLRAASSKGDVRSEGETVTTPTTARILGVSAEVEGTAATLHAVVNPEGLEGEYHFELGECATLAACPTSPYSTVLPAAQLAASTGAVSVTGKSVSGLLAGGIYHFRVVVSDVNGVALPDPEGTFVVGPIPSSCGVPAPQAQSDGLPDCRGYEMVTPSLKNGSLINNGPVLPPPALSSDGNSVLASTIQCFKESPSCVAVRQSGGVPYLFDRTEHGWTTTPLAPASPFDGTLVKVKGTDEGLLYAAAPDPALPEQFYVKGPESALTQIGPLQETPGYIASSVTSAPVDSTSDFSHIVYEGERLWGFDPTPHDKKSIFAYSGPAARPQLVDVTGERGSIELLGSCGAQLGGGANAHNGYGPLSADGQTTIFTVNRCGTGTGAHTGVPVPVDSLYARIEQAGGRMATVGVSGRGTHGECTSPQCVGSVPGDALFEGASRSGSRVFFVSTQQLTDNASEDRRSTDSATRRGCEAAAPDTSGCNLYMWECPNHCEDEGQERLVDVSAGDVSGLGAQVQGVAAVAADGGTVYFVARGVLAGVNSEGQLPAPGGNNLYVWGPGSGGHDRVAFIGTMSGAGGTLADSRQWGAGLGVANVTPDGRFLVFTSHRALTSDVTRELGPAQTYRYDAVTEKLTRVSIGQEGFDDNGNNGVGDSRIVESKNGFGVGGRADPSMSDDGAVVFFESPVGLTPGALNDEHVTGNTKILAENVYEWEQFGFKANTNASECTQPGGCVELISDGHDVTEGTNQHFNESAVELLGSDASGSNVFFETADQLVAGDRDTQIDIYDARVGGGFPAADEVSSVEPCATLEGCHAPAPAEPVVPVAGSSVFSGFGNIVPGLVKPPPPKPKTEAQIRAEKLQKALKVCKREKNRKKRVTCERVAHNRYGAVKKPKKAARRGRTSR